MFSVAQILDRVLFKTVCPKYDLVFRVAGSEFYLKHADSLHLTHNLTHNRKRAGGSNGAESTIVSNFPEQKGPQSTGKRHSEGGQSVGKDEVSSSNLDSSSKKTRFSRENREFL